jgi:hypothetical protein
MKFDKFAARSAASQSLAILWISGGRVVIFERWTLITPPGLAIRAHFSEFSGDRI